MAIRGPEKEGKTGRAGPSQLLPKWPLRVAWVEEHPWGPSIWQGWSPNATWRLSRLRAPQGRTVVGAGQRAAQHWLTGSTGAIGPLPTPVPPGVAQMALLCSPRRRRPGVLTSPAHAGLGAPPRSACLNAHLSASAIACPPAAQLSSESLDSTLKQRNRYGSFRICHPHGEQ